MELAQVLAPAVAAFLAACLLCWVMWRWRQHSVPVEDWSSLERRRRLLEGENLRLQDRVQLLEQQNQEFPGLREAISTRDDQILALEHDIGIVQAREIGISTRLEQFTNDLTDAQRRERQLEAEVMNLRSDHATAASNAISGNGSKTGDLSSPDDRKRIEDLEARLATSDALVAKAERIAVEAQRQATESESRAAAAATEVAEAKALAAKAQANGAPAQPASAASTSPRPISLLSVDSGAKRDATDGPAADDGLPEVVDIDALHQLEVDLAEAEAHNTTLEAAKAQLESEVGAANTRIDKMVIDLRDRASSATELRRLSTVANSREAEVNALQRQLAKVSARADASAVLAAELRSRLDNQLMQNSQLEQQLKGLKPQK